MTRTLVYECINYEWMEDWNGPGDGEDVRCYAEMAYPEGIDPDEQVECRVCGMSRSLNEWKHIDEEPRVEEW